MRRIMLEISILLFSVAKTNTDGCGSVQGAWKSFGPDIHGERKGRSAPSLPWLEIRARRLP